MNWIKCNLILEKEGITKEILNKGQ